MSEATLPRCSELSAADEPLAGTATRVSRWLCVEHRGGWGRDVLDDAVLGAELSAELARRTVTAGVRLMLIRRPGRTLDEPRTVLLANSEFGWCRRLTIDRPEGLLDLDLTELAGSEPDIGEAEQRPMILVCAHGKRDTCCAVFGRPIAAHLETKFPSIVWECSHTGGHRFAPSMIVLPTGYSYGRLDLAGSASVVEAALRGEVAVTGLRGRSSRTAAEQAAEVTVRARLGPSTATDLDVRESDSGVHVRHRDGRGWAVDVRTETLAPRPASCGAKPKPIPAVRVESVRPLGDHQ